MIYFDAARHFHLTALRLRLCALPLVWLSMSSLAHASRIDLPLTTPLAGSQRIGILRWNYEENDLLSNESYNEVWFDGSVYTYIYGISRPMFLDCVRGPGVCSNESPKSDYFELQTSLPVDTTWGLRMWTRISVRSTLPL